MQTNTTIIKWATLAFFCLTFYLLGVMTMLRFVAYLPLDEVHQNWQTYISLFQQKYNLWLLTPLVLYVVVAYLFYYFHKNTFEKNKLWAMLGLAFFTTLSAFVFINPIIKSLSQSMSYDINLHHNLMSKSLLLQVLPMALLSLLSLDFLRRFFSEVRAVSRWLFILIFALIFYSNGADTIEVLMEYPLWRVVGETDWLNYRSNFNNNNFTLFLGVYLIPGIVSFLLSIAFIFLRPKGLPILYPLGNVLLSIFGIYMTSTYFVPEIQEKLDSVYSTQLLDDLMAKNFILRGWTMFVGMVFMCFVFFKYLKSIKPVSNLVPAPVAPM